MLRRVTRIPTTNAARFYAQVATQADKKVISAHVATAPWHPDCYIPGSEYKMDSSLDGTDPKHQFEGKETQSK